MLVFACYMLKTVLHLIHHHDTCTFILPLSLQGRLFDEIPWLLEVCFRSYAAWSPIIIDLYFLLDNL